MPSDCLYTATCPECRSIVAGCTNRVPVADLIQDLGRWVLDGLIVGRVVVGTVQLSRHRVNCSFATEAGKEGAV